MKTTVVIWGIGERTDYYMKYGYFQECDIAAFIDTYKYGESYHGITVYAPSEIERLSDQSDFVIIATQFFSEVYEQCLAHKVPRNKIIPTDFVNEPFVYCDLGVIRSFSELLYHDMLLNQYRLIKVNEKDLTDQNRLIGREKFNHNHYISDYFRYRTFEFAAEQIVEEKITGAAAELGVFRGVFSALINQKLPDRKLYLFDTFEGFMKEEAEKETKLGRCDERFYDFHMNTSVNRMLDHMQEPSMCTVCKGFFPDSITEEANQERYAFVSVDVDFEDSMFEGLKFFFPRLAEGGFIFIHDYNSAFLGGVKNAVKRYEANAGIKLKKVPLADRAGTLVITK